MAGIWRYDPTIGGPKYLVQRRDGTVPEWPWFVLGAADPLAPWALRFYGALAYVASFLKPKKWDRAYARDLFDLAAEFDSYRKNPANRKGDPTARPHRTDDPAILAKLAGTKGA